MPHVGSRPCSHGQMGPAQVGSKFSPLGKILHQFFLLIERNLTPRLLYRIHCFSWNSACQRMRKTLHHHRRLPATYRRPHLQRWRTSGQTRIPSHRKVFITSMCKTSSSCRVQSLYVLCLAMRIGQSSPSICTLNTR